ncbi:MAG: 16S rRNA (adenine(1518)-N(6)/adenine(1519)-N(6))-dimethyltransferase RsmA [Candidatus Staskawiczbacteria bacterium]
MELTSPKIIKELLSKYETRPSKGLGQNFLIDKNVLRKIIEASNIKNDETILEVGPGLGVLTKELALKAGEVVAVEKDETMIKVLEETLKDFKNIKVINDDILKIEPETFLPKKYKVVANIPYYLTSPLIRKFLEYKYQPEEIILMLQKEVAQRICSKVGDMNLLAVSVQFYADAKIVSYVSKNCFWPAPKIDSAIIKITPHNKNNILPDDFFKIVKAGFSQPRKQLGSNLSKVLEIKKEKINEWLLKNNINSTQRAETLSIEDWEKLVRSL